MENMKKVLQLLSQREIQLMEYEKRTEEMLTASLDKIEELIQQRQGHMLGLDETRDQLTLLLQEQDQESDLFLAVKHQQKPKTGELILQDIFDISQRIASIFTRVVSMEDMLKARLLTDQEILSKEMKEFNQNHRAQGYYKTMSSDEDQDVLLNFKYDKI